MTVETSIRKVISTGTKVNSPLTFVLACLVTGGSLGIPAHALEPEEQPLDIVPFALPGTPANEVRFEESREIR